MPASPNDDDADERTLPLGLEADNATLAEHRSPTRGRDRDLRLADDPRRAADRVHRATATELEGEDLDAGISAFSRESLSQGLSEWPRERVTEPASFRLYQATATAWFIVADGHDESLPVRLP